MRTWWLCFFPTVFCLGLLLFVRLEPGVVLAWRAYPFFMALPYVVLGLVLLLGGLFRQAYLSHLSVVLIIVSLSLRIFAIDSPDVHMERGILVVSYVMLPLLAVLLFRSAEQSLFSAAGVCRLVLVVGTVCGLFFLCDIEPLRSLTYSGYRYFVVESSQCLPLPLAGLGILALSLPFLLFKTRMNALQGYFLFLALESVLLGLSFDSWIWKQANGIVVLHSFFAGAGLLFIYAILENLWRNSAIDALTQLPNRRALEDRMTRLKGEYCMAVIDVDHFKRINDRYGHDTGDQTLRFVASHLVGGKGTVYRYGGEEFVVIFEKTSELQALNSLDGMRRRVAGRGFVVRSPDRPRRRPRHLNSGKTSRKRETVKITVSVGLACSSGTENPKEVMAVADKAMYEAKNSGRNRVVVS